MIIKPLSASDIVIFGGMGDLSMRKIIPALYFGLNDGKLPENSRIILSGRHEIKPEELKEKVKKTCKDFIDSEHYSEKGYQNLEKCLHYVQIDASNAKDYSALKKILEDDPHEVRVFYLATPASIFGAISHHLKETDLITPSTRVVLEKPIGYDLESFNEINNSVLACFTEEQIYRIDHYLGKETVQNLMVLRFANNVFERIWNKDAVDHVQITVAEDIGVGSRSSYYDEAGAMRDMIQNHLLQLLCLVGMESPACISPNTVRDEKLKVLRSLRPIKIEDIAKDTVRGQYRAGNINGEAVSSYQEDLKLEESNTETFVAIKANIDNWRWSGVPFYLRTGKRLYKRYSEVVINFRPVPHDIFPDMHQSPQANRLIIRLQPEEYVRMRIITKIPGPGGYRLKPVNLDLSLDEEFDERRPDAYERLLLDVVRGNPTLFMRSDEVEAAWTWTEYILDGWKQKNMPAVLYNAGSWGPEESHGLMARDGRRWHNDES